MQIQGNDKQSLVHTCKQSQGRDKQFRKTLSQEGAWGGTNEVGMLA